jgi:hypothetical protein
MQESSVGRRLVWFAALASLALTGTIVLPGPPIQAADGPCPAETEPNDAPETAPVSSGPVCVAGTLPEGDQDVIVWELGEVAARQTWTISLDGVDETVTSVRILEVSSQPGVTPITAGALILQLDSGADAVGPVSHSGIVFRPERLIVGVSRSGMADGSDPPATAYQLRIVPDGPLPPTAESEPNDDRASATPVAASFDVGGDLSGSNDEYAWTVAGTDQGTGWTVELDGPVHQGTGIYLYDAAGNVLVDRTEDAWGASMLPDLVLAPGTYTLEVSGTGERALPYRLRAVAGPLTGDPEPNDLPSQAVPLDAHQPVARGRLYPANDRDTWLLRIPAGAPEMLRDLKLRSEGSAQRRMCLSTLDGSELQCRDGEGGAVMRSVALAPGDYVLSVSGDADPEQGYLLRIDTTAVPQPDFEQEPNDDPARATSFDPAIEMRGVGAFGDVDYYRLVVAEEAQLYQLTTTGASIARFAWTGADGTSLAEADIAPDQSSGTLTDVYLVPGEHWFRVEADGDYRIAVKALGPPDPNAELEPNNDAAHAQGYRSGRTDVVGRLPSSRDTDVYRFSLAATERLRLVVEPPQDGAVDLRLEGSAETLATRRAGDPGVPTEADVLLEAGDYEVWLTPGVPSTGRYRFRIERGDPLATVSDEEPNDDVGHASPFPMSLVATGDLPSGDAGDWYSLPPIDPTTPITVRVTAGTSASLSDGSSDIGGSWDDSGRVLTVDGASGLVPRFLRVSGSGPYQVSVEAAGLTAVPPPPPLPVTAALTLDSATVAAYWPDGQQLTGTIELTGTGEGPTTVDLDTLTSHFAWRADVDPMEVTVPAGQSVKLPVTVSIGPDAWADDPVRIEVRARDATGAQVTASATANAARDADPVAPIQAWALPDALLGGLDVASLALGAATIPSVDQTAEDQLHDGIAHVGLGFAEDVATLPLTLTVDLAGDGPLPVAGFILDPLGMDGLSGEVPRDIEFLLSGDGVTWTSVLTARLSTLMHEQAFVLPAPVPATRAQLRLLDSRAGGFGRVVLGEWKVIATPGTAPVPGPIDIAQPSAGGHVAWIDPQQGDPHTGDAYLGDDATYPDGDPSFQQLYLPDRARLTFAVGFHDDRAARITQVEWVDPVPSSRGQRFDKVAVDVSLDGAAGPWTPLATWSLERAADGSVEPLTLPEPTWARFLRFTATGGDKRQPYRDPPAAIHILEVPAGPDYRSILGQWGATRSVGPLEWLEPPDLSSPPSGPDAGDTADRPLPIMAGSPVSGRIEPRTDVDWYSFTVPEGQNTVELDVAGQPIVGVALTLVDDQGYEVPMLFGAGDRPGTVRYVAEVAPGASYRLQVVQPPSSIVFTYDTSASMGPYLDYVFQGMRAFTADVTPGAEGVMIIPFEEQPLLPDWSDDPYALQNAVDRYVTVGGSSSAEVALITASTELSAREGARAVLLVTDAETGGSYQQSTELWQVLSSVRPLIFAVHVGSSGEPVESTDFMQDWAGAAGGFYQYTRSHGEMDRAFDRLATWLRRPAAYTFSFQTSFEEKPPPSQKPGTIEVASPGTGIQAAIAPDVAAEIILDTSGSMLERIKGERKIDLAKRVLRDLLGSKLPAGMAVALRTFGAPGDPCGTGLAAPLGPLDPRTMMGLIDGLRVVQKTNTPIGAALASVPDDLRSATGTRIVVLLTDGQETCKGNPGAAIRDLRRHGIDARVNLVGLALTDKRLKVTMRKWARAGNGTYFDAKSKLSLGRALRLAVSAPFRILDAAGNEVASGTVDGDPVPVTPGTYSVVVLTDPIARFDDIEVGPGRSRSLMLPEADTVPAASAAPSDSP